MPTKQKIKYPLWLAWDNGEAPRFIIGGSAPDYWENATRVDDIDLVTLDQLVHGLDSGLEDGNHHNFTGMASALRDIIVSHSSPETAKAILWDVACKGGFDELGN
jgi:hypothetical protein